MITQVLLPNSIAPIDAQKEMYIVEIAYTAYEGLLAQSVPATPGTAMHNELKAKYETALNAASDARFKLEQFLLASQDMKRLDEELKCTAIMTKYKPEYAKKEVRLLATIKSIEEQAHLIPAIEAFLYQPVISEQEKAEEDEYRLSMDMELYAHRYDTMDGYVPPADLKDVYEELDKKARQRTASTMKKKKRAEKVKVEDFLCPICQDGYVEPGNNSCNSCIKERGEDLPF